jgi:hypothetical protein
MNKLLRELNQLINKLLLKHRLNQLSNEYVSILDHLYKILIPLNKN